MTSLGDEDVCWLDVAMNNSLRVRGVQCVGNFDGKINEALGFEWPCEDQLAQILARQVLHDNERAALKFTDLVDRADVGVIERGSSASLAAESFEGLSILGHVVGQKLERDKAAELGVFRLVDHTHPPATQILQNAVVRDGLAD